MAKLDEYWNQIKSSESFRDLADDQKEKVRLRLFDQYVQKSPSYSGLPQSQRLKVKTHFDDLTKIEPEGMVAGLERTAKPLIESGKKALDTAGKVYNATAEVAKQIEPLPVRKTFEAATELTGGIRKGTEALAEKVEPDFVKPSLTDFDVARAAASGIIRTGGEFLAGAIPTDPIQMALYPAIDGLLKYAGTTFLGREIHVPGWKPKTGLSAADTSLGSEFEKIVTRRRIENNGRMMTDCPPKPLEVLANKESELKAQMEVDQYQEWLEQVDKISPSGGAPAGDLYPAAKVNITQLRDLAKERLRKLQSEPVRIESLGAAEDELRGYFRRRLSAYKPGETIELPGRSIPEKPQAMLPEGPKPAGLLKAGPEPSGSSSKTPSLPNKTPGSPNQPPNAAPTPELGETGIRGYKNFIADAFKSRLPGETKQAIDNLAGSLMGALKDQGFIHPTKPKPLNADMMDFLDKLVDQAATHVEQPKPAIKTPALAKESEHARLKEKGLDPLEVQTEAKRLQAQHESMRGITDYEDAIQQNGGLAMNPPDPTGRIPEQEEFLRNVPIHLRGQVMPDKMAQTLFDAGLQADASSSTMYRKLAERKAAGQPRSIKSFLDEAEYRLEHENHAQAGFKSEPKQGVIPGTPAAQMPQTGLGKAEGQVPSDQLLEGFSNQDIQQRPLFDIVTDVFKEMGEKGQVGGEIDPVQRARLEASVKELVDRAMTLGYETTQDIMLYAARNAPKDIQDAIRKNLAPTLSAFDTHAYQEMEAARQGNPVAQKSMMEAAQRGYFQKKIDIVKGVWRKFDANRQIAIFKDGDEGLMKLQNDLFIHDNYRKFSKDELVAQRWYLEGKSPKLESLTRLGVPEDVAKRRLELAKHPTEQMVNARKMTQVFEDEYYDLISQFYDRVGYVEDHVTRRWKQSREYLDWEGRTLGNKPNFLKGRKLLTQADGVDAGHEPVSWDIRDDLRASNHTRVNVMSRIHAYQKLGASFGPDGTAAIIDESGDALTQAKNAKITPHTGTAPNSWLRFDHVPLLKGLAIHPYYEPVIKYLMARPFQGTVPEILSFAAASTKATKLIGFFHGYTLGEMLASGVSYRDVFTFNKNRNVLFKGLRYAVDAMTADLEGKPLSKNPVQAVGELYDSFMSGHGALANRPLALEMAEHGFKFGSADEDMHSILRQFLVKTEDYLKKRIGEKAAKGLTALPRGAVDIQEKALWSYIRPVSSMLVYENNLADAIKTFNLDAAEGAKIPIDQIKSMIANQTSKEMGGISYARFMMQPKTQQVLQWLMLAPGWTIGRALMGASVLEKGPEGRQARKQMAKLFTGWFVASNMINYAQTKKYLGTGRYMWENPEGYKNQAFMKKDDKGTSYIQLSKALTEIYDDVMHPMRTMAYKISPPVQAAAKVMNWATAKAYYPGVEPENPGQALLHAYEPMITAGQSAYGGLPVRRGPSANKVMGMLDEYYQGGMKNEALFEEAMQAGTEQGYDVGKLDRSVRAARTSKEKRALLQ